MRVRVGHDYKVKLLCNLFGDGNSVIDGVIFSLYTEEHSDVTRIGSVYFFF